MAAYLTTAALKLELEKRGWTVHLENGTTAGPCLFERIGDNLHHLLPYLDVASLCRLDAAMTNLEARETAWLPRLAGLDNADLVLKEMDKPGVRTESATAWMAALRWLVSRRVQMPKNLCCPFECDANQFLACFERCTTAASVCQIDLLRGTGTFTAAGMMTLQRCTGLTRLCIPRNLVEEQDVWSQLDVENWSCFQTITHVRDNDPFSQSISKVTAEIWGRRFRALVEIHITISHGVLEQLCKIQSLQVVAINCKHVTTAAEFAHLGKLPAMRSLDLHECAFVDQALGQIMVLPLLRDLTLTMGEGLSTVGISLITKSYPALTNLSFWNVDVTDLDVAVLTQLTALRCLLLSSFRDDSKITDAGMTHLRGFPFLQELHLDGCQNITSESLAVIGDLVHLRELTLSYCPFLFEDESALRHLRSLTNLTSFTATCCSFPDAGLDSLHSAANLETLSVGDDNYDDDEKWKVTEAGLERLVAACPKLKEILLDEYDEKDCKRHIFISAAFKDVLRKRGIQLKPY